MRAQGDYTNQFGSDRYAPEPGFQQRPPAAALPPPPHHGPFASQPQSIQQGRPPSHPTPGISSYQHAPPSVPHQGPTAPVVSSGMSSAHSYVSHTQTPELHVNNQISNSYPTSEQHVRWNQNVHPVPPRAPLPGPSAYPQGQSGPPCQYPPPPLPSYSSSSNFFMSDPFGSSALPTRQLSYLQSMGQLPPPPPPPSSYPPRVPPLPPSSPTSGVPIKNDGSLFNGDKLMVEHPSPAKPAEVRDVHQNEFPCHQSDNNVSELDAAVAHSPADSDMEMEDDITHPDEEKKESTNSNGGTSMSPEDYVKEQLHDLQHTRECRVPKDALPENLLFPEAPVLMRERGGSEVVPHSDFPVTMKVFSEDDESAITKNGQTEQSLEASGKESFSAHENPSQPSVPVVYDETGNGEIPGMEGANAFNLLHCYASDNVLENAGENLLGDARSPALNGGSTNLDAQNGRSFGSKVRVESLSESNEHMLPKSIIESPRNVMAADKSSSGTGILEQFSDKIRRGQESVTTSGALQSKDPSRSSDAYLGIEGINFYKQVMKSNPTELKVDEFGRFVREGVSDSDTSDSPRYKRRHARRARKRSSSRSRSRSPHDRRRRSPWRRKGRRGRSRSLSPRRRRSRSRSPVLRRDNEFSGGDRQRREKTQLPECFDFLRGKCYRGATCRYSHHEADKSERLRYSRGKQQSTVRCPDVHEEGKVLYDKEVKDKGPPQDMPGLREVRDGKELPVDKLNSLVSSSLPVSDVVASNLSGYLAHDIPLGKEHSLILESPAHFYDKMPQSVEQQGTVSESSSLVQASAATSAKLLADKPDADHDPTSQLLSVESPITKPYSTEKVQSQSSKVLPASVGNHSSQFTTSISQVTSAPFGQDNILMPPILQFHLTTENHSPYQAPVAYQHSRFPGPSSPFLPPPPSLPPSHHLAVNATLGEYGIPSQHAQQSLQPPRDDMSSYTSIRERPTELSNRSQTSQYQVYPLPQEPDQMLHITENIALNCLHVSNLSNLQSGPRIIGERVTKNPVQGMHTLQSFSQAQPYSLKVTSPSKATHTNLGGGRPSDSNSSHGHPYMQQGSYGLQYSAGGGVPAQFSQPETMSSSIARTAPDFLERNQPSCVHNFMGSSIANHFNPYASTFDLPLSSKFKMIPSIQENDTTINAKYGVPVGSGSVDAEHTVASVVSKNMITTSSPGLPAQSLLPRLGGDQYDPLFDSIEPASTSLSRADHKKHETPGDSDNMPRFSGSGRVLNDEIIKHEGETALSANDSVDNEEFGETADAEVGAVLNGSPSTPYDETNMNAGEVEIDQVKASRKKRKGKDSRSMKLFKSSVATFVKEVLKPSWRQGNMSKEAFKTIVKKTVDKVSGAMKGHRVPKSQAKINHYIDSSRGKLIKLVMGYVDKYVKV